MPSRFWVWIYSSRVLVVFSSMLLILGLLSIPLGSFGEHALLMLLGARLFYSGVMWAQIPGYAGYMPHPLLSILIASLEISGGLLATLGIWLWAYLFSISGLIHASIYIHRKAIGSSWLKLPNILTLAGLLHSSLSLLLRLPPIHTISFPLLSAISLMIRVDPNINGYRISKPVLYAYIAISIASLTASPIIGAETLIPIAGLVIAPLSRIKVARISWKMRVEDLYRLGSAVAKILGSSSLIIALTSPGSMDHIHLVLVGFLAVIMSSLCTPLLLPGIMGRAYKALWTPIPVIIALIGIVRAASVAMDMHVLQYTIDLAALTIIAIILYIIYMVISSEKAL